MKLCRLCKQTKPREDFYPHQKAKDGLRGECIACQKQRHKGRYSTNPDYFRTKAREWAQANPEKVKLSRVKRYGLTKEQYESLPKVCAICGATENLHIDHDHTSGHFRGILCGGCNVGIGHFKEDVARMRAAIKYLENGNASSRS